MPVRYKHLVSGGIDTAAWSEAGSRRLEDREALDWNEVDAPPRTVESHEGEGSLDEVRLFVRLGKLLATDLVDLGRGWQTVADVPELEEALAKAPRRRAFPLAFLAILASWAAGSAGLLAGGLDLYWVLFLSFFAVPAIAALAWNIRRDVIQHSAHRGATPTVTSLPLPAPGEAAPGSLSLSAPTPQSGALSVDPVSVESPAPEPEGAGPSREKQRGS